jgi:hypothetical protein
LSKVFLVEGMVEHLSGPIPDSIEGYLTRSGQATLIVRHCPI